MYNPTVGGLIAELQKHDPNERIIMGTDGRKTYASFYPMGTGFELEIFDGSWQNTCYLGVSSV